MFCPQCGTEAPAGQPYCRSCGANLKVIGKAVTLSEAIARSDRGPLPKLKEMIKNLKVEHVTDEVSRALDQMNTEIVRSSAEPQSSRLKFLKRRQKTPEERRSRLIERGIVSIFSGAGLTVFLYFLTNATVLHLPPDIVGMIPVEVDRLVHVLWIIGLFPVLTGIGRLLAALTIRVNKVQPAAAPTAPPSLNPETENRVYSPPSVTERTTNLLNKT